VADEIVAIDGPAGSGKSTVARLLAERLGFVYIDSGAMYRAVALRATRDGIDPTDDDAVRAMAEAVDVRLVRSARGPRTLLDGRDVSDAIRTPEISLAASRTSAHPAVRAAMTRLQRAMGASGGVVMEGRDIGTVVFPAARYKFFLTASDEVRAGRRFDELRGRGNQAVTRPEVLADLRRRDDNDAAREHAPLRKADDAIAIDTTPLTVEQVVQVCLDHIHRIRGDA
jgi:cytidylate kinase